MGRSVGWFSLPSWRCCCSVALLCSTLLMPYKTALMRLMLSDSPFQSKSITSILDLYSLASRSILCKAYSSYSKKEIAYETEFDMRPTISYPHDFPQWDYETLSVRIPGFNKIDHFESDGTLKGTEFIKNWELFAIRYWYETRVPFSECPMKPRGIATRTDWSFMIPCIFGNPHNAPRTIFVHHYMLSHFIESTLRFMDPSFRFVLITGGTDLTIPRSTDQRYTVLRGFSSDSSGGKYFQTLVNAPQLIHWFCENHDLKHEKISTLPTGMTDDADDRSYFPDPKTVQPVQERQLRVLVSDRVRDGRGQWETRKRVQDMCLRHADFCLHPQPINSEQGMSHKDFVAVMVSVPLIACAHGGGIDPSPKAWESMLLGTIPIIQSSVLDDAYQHFPVIFVRTWEEFFNFPNVTRLMHEWVQRLAPYYQRGSALRNQTLQRLKTDYWMSLVYEKLERYDREHNILDSTARRRLRSSDSDAHYSDAYGMPAIYFRL